MKGYAWECANGTDFPLYTANTSGTYTAPVPNSNRCAHPCAIARSEYPGLVEDAVLGTGPGEKRRDLYFKAGVLSGWGSYVSTGEGRAAGDDRGFKDALRGLGVYDSANNVRGDVGVIDQVCKFVCFCEYAYIYICIHVYLYMYMWIF
jgi:hypothetical protein